MIACIPPRWTRKPVTTSSMTKAVPEVSVIERCRRGIVEDHDILGRGWRNARRDCQGARRVVGANDALYEHLVELAVIGAIEQHDLVAPRHGAGDAQRRHHGFGTRV